MSKDLRVGIPVEIFKLALTISVCNAGEVLERYKDVATNDMAAFQVLLEALLVVDPKKRVGAVTGGTFADLETYLSYSNW